ncbi:hypothetical protein HDR70_02445 [bacterium]|nr:hypothetical protein [bacterium]
MKTKLSPCLVGVLMMSSCQINSEIPELTQNHNQQIEVSTKLPQSLIEKNIIINVMSNHFGGYSYNASNTRALSEFSLHPMVLDGDTVMYVAQYEEGWELYSANPSMEMVPFSSPEGTFNFNDPNLPDALKTWINETATQISASEVHSSDYIDPSWGPLAVSNEQLSNGNLMVLNDNGSYSTCDESDLPPGHWELIESQEINKEFDSTLKLTNTKWGQREPWNTYSDKILNNSTNTYESALAGCGPVAMAQYVYFIHQKDGFPILFKMNPILNANYTYSFSTIKFNIFPWDNIILEKNGDDANTTAILIGYIGHRLNANYGLNATSTTNEDFYNYLNSAYNQGYEMLSFNETKVINTLKKGYPVFISALSTLDTNNVYQDPVGHVFLIDYYQKEEKTMQYAYGWVRDPLPVGTVDKWVADLKDTNGNIIKYAYINKDLPFFIKNEKISMNWGWNGSYDNTLYSINSSWAAGNNIYNTYKHIFLPKE